jgi:hypothetical protein
MATRLLSTAQDSLMWVLSADICLRAAKMAPVFRPAPEKGFEEGQDLAAE